MSKTPLLDFLKRSSKEPGYSEKVYDRVMKVFEAEGLSDKHARILLSGNKRLFEAEVTAEIAQSGEPGQTPKGVGPMLISLWFKE
jgi:hypothetical protein